MNQQQQTHRTVERTAAVASWIGVGLDMGRDATKPVFGVSDKARLNQSPQLQRLARKF